jgi:hypothetical protein
MDIVHYKVDAASARSGLFPCGMIPLQNGCGLVMVLCASYEQIGQAEFGACVWCFVELDGT